MCWSSYHHYRSEDRGYESRSTGPPASDLVGAGGNLRVSDAERNRMVDVLKQHTADGRLTLDEFEARVEETLSARTGTELRAVLRELPSLETARSPRPRGPSRPMTRLPLVAIAVVVVVWLTIGHLTLWPFVIVGVFCFRASAGRRPSAPPHDRAVDRTDSEDMTFV